MSETKLSENRQRARMSRYVRFNPEEHRWLEEDEKRTGKTGSALLKEAYFGRKPTAVLMKDEDKNYLCIQINRIGNNVNQVAKRINSGFAQGFEQDLETIRAQLAA